VTLVPDCFVGSGTSAVAAILERRRFIGVDNSPQFVLMARKAMDVAIHEVLNRLDLEERPGERVADQPPGSASSNDAYQLGLLLEKRGIYDFHNEV